MVYNGTMKKIIFFVVIILFGLSVNVAFAQLSTFQPFGGKILLSPIPGVVCPAGKIGSPFTLVPNGPYPTGPFVGDYYPVSNFHLLVPGAWILGLTNIVPLPECSTPPVPPATVPVPVNGFRTILHGTSVQVSG